MSDCDKIYPLNSHLRKSATLSSKCNTLLWNWNS